MPGIVLGANFGRLFWIGLGFIFLYSLLAWQYPLAPSLADPRATWGLMVAPTWPNLAYHLAIYLGLTLLYVLALRLLAALHPSLPRRLPALIVGVWLACSAVLLATAPGGESHAC